MKGIVFDLELNQPSQAVIEIGAYLVNYKSYNYLAEFQLFCRLPEGECLNPDVAKLCNITEEQVNAGVDRSVGIQAFWDFVVESKSGGNLACWGDDLDILIEQSRALGVVVPPGISGYNVLSASKRFGIRAGPDARRGLKSALKDVGIPWVGERHRACPDSWNLAQYEFHILQCLEKYRKAEQFVADFHKEKVVKKRDLGGFQDYLAPETLENKAIEILGRRTEPLKVDRTVPEIFSYKGVSYKYKGPARMEDSLGNWLDGFHYMNEEGKTFFRSTHSFNRMQDGIDKS